MPHGAQDLHHHQFGDPTGDFRNQWGPHVLPDTDSFSMLKLVMEHLTLTSSWVSPHGKPKIYLLAVGFPALQLNSMN